MMVPLSLTRKWSLTCVLPVFVISNQDSERAHRKDIHANIHTQLHTFRKNLCQTQHFCIGVSI